jgi:hypothetical protein
MQKAFYQTRLTLIIANLFDAKNPDILKEKSPKAYKHFEKMHELYKQIDDLGYEELPTEIYANWLKYLASEKEKHQNKKTLLMNEIK